MRALPPSLTAQGLPSHCRHDDLDGGPCRCPCFETASVASALDSGFPACGLCDHSIIWHFAPVRLPPVPASSDVPTIFERCKDTLEGQQKGDRNRRCPCPIYIPEIDSKDGSNLCLCGHKYGWHRPRVLPTAPTSPLPPLPTHSSHTLSQVYPSSSGNSPPYPTRSPPASSSLFPRRPPTLSSPPSSAQSRTHSDEEQPPFDDPLDLKRRVVHPHAPSPRVSALSLSLMGPRQHSSPDIRTVQKPPPSNALAGDPDTSKSSPDQALSRRSSGSLSDLLTDGQEGEEKPVKGMVGFSFHRTRPMRRSMSAPQDAQTVEAAATAPDAGSTEGRSPPRSTKAEPKTKRILHSLVAAGPGKHARPPGSRGGARPLLASLDKVTYSRP